MVQLKLNNLNIIDVAVIIVVFLVVVMGGAYYLNKPHGVNTYLKVTFHVGDPVISAAIHDQAVIDKTVYLNSIDAPVDVVSVNKVTNAIGNLEALDIVLEGPGYTDEKGNYVFNGQRVLINQKAEIHGNYFVSGAITKVENAN